MAYPSTIAPTITSLPVANEGTQNFPIMQPSGVSAGDLLLVMTTYYTNVMASPGLSLPTGWLVLNNPGFGSQGETALLYKIADGSESDQTFLFSLTSFSMFAATAHCYKISGGVFDIESATPIVQQNSSSIGMVNSPTVTPSWVSSDTLYFTFSSSVRSTKTIALPSGYASVQSTGERSTTNYGANVLSGYKESTETSDNAGTYTWGSYQGQMTLGVAIRITSLDPLVTTTDTLRPGTEFTLTATNYASAPVSPATFTDSAGNSITVPVTISGSGPYTAVGTMPTLAEAVTAGTSLLFGDVTIELTT